MKKLLITGTLMGAIMTLAPTLSLAATYQYVNTSGNVSVVTADNAFQAMTVADIASHSGVMLVSGSVNNTVTTPVNYPVSTPATAGTYQYINIYGNVKTINAGSAAAAMNASDISPHSGVMLMTGTNGL